MRPMEIHQHHSWSIRSKNRTKENDEFFITTEMTWFTSIRLIGKENQNCCEADRWTVLFTSFSSSPSSSSFFCCCCYDHIVNISLPLHCQTKVNVKEFLLCVHRSYISPFKNRKHDLLRMGMYASSSLIFLLLLLLLGARRERIVVMIDTKEHTPHACACVCVLGGRRWGEGKGKTKNSSLSNSAKCLVVRLHYQFLC